MDIKHQLTGLWIHTIITQQNWSPSRETKNHTKMVLLISSSIYARNFFDTKEYDVHIHLKMMTLLRFSIWISNINSHVWGSKSKLRNKIEALVRRNYESNKNGFINFQLFGFKSLWIQTKITKLNGSACLPHTAFKETKYHGWSLRQDTETKFQLFWSKYKQNQDKDIFCLHQCCTQ